MEDINTHDIIWSGRGDCSICVVWSRVSEISAMFIHYKFQVKPRIVEGIFG